jgi:hypothetical protein
MGYVEEEVKRAVLRTAKRFNVSESFVVNTMLADAFGITIKEKCYEVRKRHGKKAKAHSSVRTDKVR